MTRRAITIITLGDGDAYEWSTDATAEPSQQIITAGKLSLREGKAASSLSWTLADPRLELAGALPLPQKRAKVPVSAWFGYGPALTKVFTGVLSSLQASGLPGRVSLTATDKAKGARRVPKARNLTSSSAVALIRRLAKEDGLAVDTSQAAGELDQLRFSDVLQHGESNWDVIVRLASSVGHDAFVRGDTVYLKERGSTRTDGTFEAVFGQNVANGFSFDIDELTRGTTPNVYDTDGEAVYDTGLEDIDAEARERHVRADRTGLLLTAGEFPSYSDQAAQRALAAQARAKELFKASMSLTVAAPEVDVDDHVLLRGFGARFSGAWNVGGVDHDLVAGRTSLDLYSGGSMT